MSTTLPISKPKLVHGSPAAPRKAHLGPQPSDLSAKRQYLVLYNLSSLILWVALLLRVIIVVTFSAGAGLLLVDRDAVGSSTSAIANVYLSSATFAKWVQTVALAEVLHSLLGLVRAPVLTTAMQVASRLLLVWGIVGLFGDEMLTAGTGVVGQVKSAVTGDAGNNNNQLAYLCMLLAWGFTECVRYLYFVFFLGGGQVPALLGWLRYNTFFVAYPVGISCECWLVYKALPFARQWDERYAWFLMAVLGIYVPGSYILYTHMMSQRRRAMKGKQKERSQ